jgi:hypothetical protein
VVVVDVVVDEEVDVEELVELLVELEVEVVLDVELLVDVEGASVVDVLVVGVAPAPEVVVVSTKSDTEPAVSLSQPPVANARAVMTAVTRNGRGGRRMSS